MNGAIQSIVGDGELSLSVSCEAANSYITNNPILKRKILDIKSDDELKTFINHIFIKCSSDYLCFRRAVHSFYRRHYECNYT